MMQRLRRLGYDAEERIGEGDVGTVYRARSTFDGLKVALKIARKTLRDGKWVHATERDLYGGSTELVLRLNHEGMGPLLNVHRDASPVILVLAWVDGPPITLALENASWDAKASAVASVCDAIDYAHRRGIIHGHLKPSNLLVGPDGNPKVLDIGLKGVQADAEVFVRRNSPGIVASALYLAPEQFAAGAQLRPETDVYALGVVIYELLTGQPPFGADSAHSVLDAHLHDAPELPMLKREDVPEPLQRICLKALEKSPEDRYRSVREMRDDLERYRQGKPVAVRPSYYNNLIESPARGHVAAIDRWRDQ